MRRYNSRVASTAGTQRIVSVAVADVVGSTAIGERLGPARSKFLFDEVIALMAAEVRRYDGTVAQLTGDGLLAVFGAPLAHEDDAERGVRAALAIQSAIATYADEVRGAYDIELAVRVAVNSGPVVLTDAETDDAERYNALGDTVNVAARLQTIDAEGGIVIGPETARQLQSCFELEELGDVELKGVERPVRAFRVTGERGPGPHPPPGRRWSGATAELAVLDEACDAMAEGSGAILTITGEPGIGKTRLLAEARTAGGRPRLLPGGPRDLVLAGLALLAGARPAARLAGHRRRRARGPRAPGAEGGARRARPGRSTRRTRSWRGCSASRSPTRPARRCATSAARPCRRARSPPSATSCARSPTRSRCASRSTTCSGPTTRRWSCSRSCWR